MADIDSYLLKCTLESIGKDVSAEAVQAQCECQVGLVNCDADNETSNQSKKGD